mmetsp:Transcript_27888/g.83273  ORF Transcript_27888/g.83273 Transcript_27888/m.83273 type:complete len:221 (+) Transcript_27888:1004-1666(+)
MGGVPRAVQVRGEAASARRCVRSAGHRVQPLQRRRHRRPGQPALPALPGRLRRPPGDARGCDGRQARARPAPRRRVGRHGRRRRRARQEAETARRAVLARLRRIAAVRRRRDRRPRRARRSGRRRGGQLCRGGVVARPGERTLLRLRLCADGFGRGGDDSRWRRARGAPPDRQAEAAPQFCAAQAGGGVARRRVRAARAAALRLALSAEAHGRCISAGPS